MKNRIYIIFIGLIFSSQLCLGQESLQMIMDTVTNEYKIVRTKTLASSARILAHDIQVSVSANTRHPQKLIDIHLSIGPSVNIDDIKTIVFVIWPTRGNQRNGVAIADAWLSSKAINKSTRSVDFTMGGFAPGQTCTLETSVYGLDGPPCGGSFLENIEFQTEPIIDEPKKMLLVINEEWKYSSTLQTQLDEYISDIGVFNPDVSVEKYFVANTGPSKSALYNYIVELYETSNLSYLFFIGDNAPAWSFRQGLDDNGNVISTWGASSFTQYTLPLYKHYTYDEQYNLWAKQYQNTCFRPSQEIREAVFQQRTSLISMGMVIPNSALNDEGKISYLVNYFKKLHKFKYREITFDKSILLTDGFVSEQVAVNLGMENGRWSSVSTLDFGRTKDNYYSGEDAVWKSDFMTKLGQGSYEIFSLNVHGSSTYHAFGIYANDIVNSLPQLNTRFINLLSCNVGDYRSTNYLAGLYLDKGNVISVHAYSDLLLTVTVNGASALQSDFAYNGPFTLMAEGYTISDAYRFSKSYNESEVILGDPLATLSSDVVPPVVLKSFDIQKENEIVKLLWTTTMESSSKNFEVERSKDGKNWLVIGTVTSQGEGAVNRSYSFYDNNPLAGTNLYRLKLINNDNTYSYSSICETFIDYLTTGLFPNPASDKIYFSEAIMRKIKSVTITNLLGVPVYENRLVTENEISIKGFASGIYLVKLMEENGNVDMQKIIVE